jgi:hypothetical protein
MKEPPDPEQPSRPIGDPPPKRPGKWVGAVLVALLVAEAPARAAARDVTALLQQMHRALVPEPPLRADFTLEMDNGRGDVVRWDGTIERRGGAEPSITMRFESPAELRGVEYSMQRREGELDAVRIYLPSVRRVRTLREDMQGESFLGTDFNFEDLGFEQIAYRQHTLAGEGEVDGRPCDRVASVPSRSWWYGRITRCIDREDHLPRLTEYADPAGLPYKRRLMDDVRTIDGHPTPLRIRIETIPEGTSSVLSLSNVRYGD